MTPPLSKCASCHASIYWASTRIGRAMPIDAEPSDDGNVALVWSERLNRIVCHVVADRAGFGHPLRTSHFATCPDADRFRRKG